MSTFPAFVEDIYFESNFTHKYAEGRESFVLQRWRIGFSIYGVFASRFTNRLSQQPFRTL